MLLFLSCRHHRTPAVPSHSSPCLAIFYFILWFFVNDTCRVLATLLCVSVANCRHLQLGEDFDADDDQERDHTDNLATILDRLCRAKALETRGWCVSGMANLSWQKECQELLVKAGAVEASPMVVAACFAGPGVWGCVCMCMFMRRWGLGCGLEDVLL